MLQIVKQFAIFMDNRPGALARTCQALAAQRVNVLAMSIIDAVDHAIVRLVVDRPELAQDVLARLHALVQVREVVMMDVPNEHGALARIAERLAEAAINIEYAYCTGSPTQQAGALILRTNDLEGTINALS
jgi:hypothetical protein